MDERKSYLWEQIRDDIRKDIISGKLKADERLPSVRELVEKYNVSMPVVKRAYTSLEYSGLVYMVNGKGTYVSPNALTAEQKRLDEIIVSQSNFDGLNKDIAVSIADRLNMLYAKMLVSNNFGSLDLLSIKISASLLEQIADIMADGTDLKEFLSQNDGQKGNK